MLHSTTPRITAFVAAVTLFSVLSLPRPAEAKPEWLSAFIAEYPSATHLFTCGTCHGDFAGPQDDDFVAIVATEDESRRENPYGKAFAEAGGGDHAAAALRTIENLDSDHDGTSNINEILSDDGFMPGWNCGTYATAVNAPPTLAYFVDPVEPGCGLATTTTLPATSTTVTTVTSSTTSTTSTSITLPADGECGSPISGSSLPSATDCLFILGAAVGIETCDSECLCAPKGSLPISATDALLCLRAAVGDSITLDCPCGGSTTTSTTVTSSTSTTTTSTTTTLRSGVDAGRTTYDTRCSGCHKAGSHDTMGFASDLRTKGGLLVPNLGPLDPSMTGLTLSQQEIDDLRAFFSSL